MKMKDDYLIGYLAHYVSQQNAYYGGLLVTNSRGVPKEFRHSEALKPSKLHLTIFGDSLEGSLGSDTLAPALYEALTIKPDVLVVDVEGRNLFGRFAQNYKPSALLASSLNPEAELGTSFLSPDSVELLEQRVYELKGSSSERVCAYIAEESSDAIGSHALELAQKRMNLLSPFDRIRLALTEIVQVEQGRKRS